MIQVALALWVCCQWLLFVWHTVLIMLSHKHLQLQRAPCYLQTLFYCDGSAQDRITLKIWALIFPLFLVVCVCTHTHTHSHIRRFILSLFVYFRSSHRCVCVATRLFSWATHYFTFVKRITLSSFFSLCSCTFSSLCFLGCPSVIILCLILRNTWRQCLQI